MTHNDRLRAIARWCASIASFYVALQLLWPTPFGMVVWGLVLSSLIALLAFGLVLIYRSHRVINFAQADLGAVPAALCVSLVVLQGWSYWLAVPVALVAAVALGSAVEFVVIRRFERAPRLILMVATIGLAQLLAGLGQAIPLFFGAFFAPPQSLPLPFSFRFEIDPFIFHAGELTTVVATLVVAGLLFGFLRYTNLGIALRASASNADRAALLGVNVGQIHNLAWVLATVIATVGMILRAGVLGLPLGSAFGPQILLRALAAAVIGRMENLAVIFAAACAIGVVEVAIIWNEGSALLIDPVLFVIVLGALLLQRRSRESPVDDETLSTWSLAASVRPIPRELARLPEVRWVFRGLRVLFVLALFTLPALLDERYTNLAAAVVIYAIVAVSLVLLTGWAGEISLGQVAFVAIGSAAAGAANVHWNLAPVPSFLLAGLVGAVASVVIGVPALRIRGLFLSVTTLAFAVATSSFLLNHDYFPFLPDQIADRVLRRPVWTPIGHLAINTERRYYYVAAVGLVLVLLAVRGLQRSRVERDVVATRRQRAERAGVPAEPGAGEAARVRTVGLLRVLRRRPPRPPPTGTRPTDLRPDREPPRADHGRGRRTRVGVGGDHRRGVREEHRVVQRDRPPAVPLPLHVLRQWHRVAARVVAPARRVRLGPLLDPRRVAAVRRPAARHRVAGVRDRRGRVTPAVGPHPADPVAHAAADHRRRHTRGRSVGSPGSAHRAGRARVPGRRRRVRARPSPLRRQPRRPPGRDGRAARHERRGEVDHVADRVRPAPPVPRPHPVRGCGHWRPRAAQGRRPRRVARTRRTQRVPVAVGARQPEGGGVVVPARPRGGPCRYRAGAGHLPVAARPARRPRGDAVGRPAADADDRDVAGRRAEGPHDRRVVARAEPVARRATARRGPRAARQGRDRRRGGAGGEHRARRPRTAPTSSRRASSASTGAPRNCSRAPTSCVRSSSRAPNPSPPPRRFPPVRKANVQR